MLLVKQFYFNELRECTYILSDDTKESIIVDPGMSSPRECERIEKYIADNSLTLKKIVLTHGHFDHVMGSAWVRDKYNIPTYIHKADKGILQHAKQTCAMFGINIEEPPTDTIDLIPEDFVTFGETKLQVISTPGHTWGSVCLYSPQDNICLSGDTLFAGNCGRTDLPEGDNEMMCNSLTKILAQRIKPECEIYAGHGPKSSMSEELVHNPYLKTNTWIGFID